MNTNDRSIIFTPDVVSPTTWQGLQAITGIEISQLINQLYSPLEQIADGDTGLLPPTPPSVRIHNDSHSLRQTPEQY